MKTDISSPILNQRGQKRNGVKVLGTIFVLGLIVCVGLIAIRKDTPKVCKYHDSNDELKKLEIGESVIKGNYRHKCEALPNGFPGLEIEYIPCGQTVVHETIVYECKGDKGYVPIACEPKPDVRVYPGETMVLLDHLVVACFHKGDLVLWEARPCGGSLEPCPGKEGEAGPKKEIPKFVKPQRDEGRKFIREPEELRKDEIVEEEKVGGCAYGSQFLKCNGHYLNEKDVGKINNEIWKVLNNQDFEKFGEYCGRLKKYDSCLGDQKDSCLDSANIKKFFVQKDQRDDLEIFKVLKDHIQYWCERPIYNNDRFKCHEKVFKSPGFLAKVEDCRTNRDSDLFATGLQCDPNVNMMKCIFNQYRDSCPSERWMLTEMCGFLRGNLDKFFAKKLKDTQCYKKVQDYCP